MTAQIKYLLFKGLAKKEEILFKSFLNLAKNDLAYQIVVLKANQVDADDPDIVILDELYELQDDEQKLADLPTVLVGDDHRKDDDNYITRPVQWSEFKHAITSLEISVEIEQNSENDVRVLPEDIQLAINDEDSVTEDSESLSATSEEPGFSDEGDYEYELDKLSVDYHSFTNSDYIKVVDDVKQFKDVGEIKSDEPVILVSDDESASVNSVLVLETNSMDAWEISESDFSVSQIVEGAENKQNSHSNDFDEPETEEVILEQRAGFAINRDDEFWTEDNEIIVDNETLMFVKPEREMVYSEIEPGKWPGLIQRGPLSKAPLATDWRPTEGLNVYPLSSLLWVHTLINATSDLDSPFDDDAEYQLESWPHFDLLELDNVLLKLCTMLFVRPESVSSLASKSGYARSTIRGLMNACYQLGILKLPEQISGEQTRMSNSDEGMLGKIKDVFR